MEVVVVVVVERRLPADSWGVQMDYRTKCYCNRRGPKFIKVFILTLLKLFKSYIFMFYVLTLQK